MPEDLAPGTPAEVVERAKAGPGVPRFDATLGREVTVGDRGARKHRLVVIGDSLSHGFQSRRRSSDIELSYPRRSSRNAGLGTASRLPALRWAGRAPAQPRVAAARARAATSATRSTCGICRDGRGPSRARASARRASRTTGSAAPGSRIAAHAVDQARPRGLRLGPARRPVARRRRIEASSSSRQGRPASTQIAAERRPRRGAAACSTRARTSAAKRMTPLDAARRGSARTAGSRR